MRIKQFFQLAIVALALSATACSDEIASQEDDQGLVLKDGETAVQMNIAGINGKSLARAASDNVTLPGEVKIDKLDIYCFVDLDDQSTSTAVTGIDNYTLERMYHYTAQGDANDIVLTPDGDGYKASFGVQKNAERKRAFILVANDNVSRTVTASTDITLGNSRSGAAAFSVVKAWDILETNLSATAANIATPLVMQSTAQWSTYDTDGVLQSSNEYDAAKLAEGISATLTRRVARIDISNPVATGFTVTSVTLTGAKNAPLFNDIAAIGDDQTVAFTEKTVTNAEVINGALYALPMNADDTRYPSVEIKGKLGTTELTVTANFKGDAMTSAIKGMQPNTRYVVNILNTEGNLTAYITIADWAYGETVDTDDIAAQLNAEATLDVTDSVTLSTKTMYLKYTATYQGGTFATVSGAASDKKPIGIVLPDDCDWITVEKDNTETGKAKYNLKYNAKSVNQTGRPRTANLSLISYNTTDKKQVINEYTIYQDYLDIKQLSGSLEAGSIWALDEAGDSPVLYLPPFGINFALMYNKIDFVIPEECTWLITQKEIIGEANIIGVTDNVGRHERQTVVTLRKWNSTAIETKEVTIIQSGTVDKTSLCANYQIILNDNLVKQNRVKFDEAQSTIIIAGNLKNLNSGGDNYIFYIRGEIADQSRRQDMKPILVQFGQNDNTWIKPIGQIYMPNKDEMAHEYKVPFPDMQDSTEVREMNFTVTTYANGVPVEKTYRLIQKASTTQTVD